MRQTEFYSFVPGQTVVIYARKPQRSSRSYPRLLYDIVGSMGQTISVLSLAGLMLLAWPMVSVEVSYRLHRLPSEPSAQTAQAPVPQQPLPKPEETLSPVDPSFSVVIPKIDLNTNVVANVNAADRNEYLPALTRGIAHAAGSSIPGQLGTTYIFGHSTDHPWNVTRLNAQFFLLKELESGDEINVFHQGRRHRYQVTKKVIAEAEDVSFLKTQSREEKLLLQTCWPPGTTLKRLIVEASPVTPSVADATQAEQI